MTDVKVTKEPLFLSLERNIDAPRRVVWRCWTEPDLVKEWFCPKPWRVSKADFDLKPGGRMNIVMEGPEGERHDSKGVWLLIEPEHRLVFTDSFTEGFKPAESPFMTGEVLLSDEGDGRTRMIWSARHATEDATKQHLEMGFEDGWKAASQQLEDLAINVAKS